MGTKNFKSVTLHVHPFEGVIHRLGFAKINLHTKFEVSMFTCYKDMKGNAKCRNLGGFGWYRSPKVTSNVTVR